MAKVLAGGGGWTRSHARALKEELIDSRGPVISEESTKRDSASGFKVRMM
jgi:hypothetical protein